MAVHLEAAYLANVLLSIEGAGTAKAFPLISTQYMEATLSHKKTPWRLLTPRWTPSGSSLTST